MNDNETLLEQIGGLIQMAGQEYRKMMSQVDTEVIIAGDRITNRHIGPGYISIEMDRKKTTLGDYLDAQSCHQFYSFAIDLPLEGKRQISIDSFAEYEDTLELLNSIAQEATSMYTREADANKILQSVLMGVQGMADLLIRPTRLLQQSEAEAMLPKRTTMDLIASILTAREVFEEASDEEVINISLAMGSNRGGETSLIGYSDAKLEWEQLGNTE
jgi:hypothetical protein